MEDTVDIDRKLAITASGESGERRGMERVFYAVESELSEETRLRVQAMIDEQKKNDDEAFDALVKHREKVFAKYKD